MKPPLDMRKEFPRQRISIGPVVLRIDFVRIAVWPIAIQLYVNETRRIGRKPHPAEWRTRRHEILYCRVTRAVTANMNAYRKTAGISLIVFRQNDPGSKINRPT